MSAQVICGWGSNGTDWQEAEEARSRHATTYQDHATVIVMPTRGSIPARVVDSFMSMMRPPNTRITQFFMSGMEVGAAYNQAVQMILDHPDLKDWRWMLTIEEDNLIPPMALLDLQREATVGGYDVLGGLYWTKGEEGCPQIWGDPTSDWNFRPIPPVADAIVDTNATGMGCTLFDLDIFRNNPGPWFETVADPERGMFTQDLYFFHRLHEEGVELRVGVDCRVKVGHLDVETGRVW